MLDQTDSSTNVDLANKNLVSKDIGKEKEGPKSSSISLNSLKTAGTRNITMQAVVGGGHTLNALVDMAMDEFQIDEMEAEALVFRMMKDVRNFKSVNKDVMRNKFSSSSSSSNFIDNKVKDGKNSLGSAIQELVNFEDVRKRRLSLDEEILSAVRKDGGGNSVVCSDKDERRSGVLNMEVERSNLVQEEYIPSSSSVREEEMEIID
jgi:hypothetical protein